MALQFGAFSHHVYTADDRVDSDINTLYSVLLLLFSLF